MRLRSRHIVLALFALIILFVGYVAFFYRPSPPIPQDGDFLDEAHALQRGVDADVGTGSLPPADADESLVPAIVVEPSRVDLGQVPNDRKTTATATVYNRGKARLEISQVKTNCACTIGELGRDVLEPGQSTTLTITLDPFRIRGFVSVKQLTFFSNDPKHGDLTLEVHATITPEFILEPMGFDLGAAPQGSGPSLTAELRQAGPEPIALAGVEPADEAAYFRYTFDEKPEAEWAAPGKPEYRITTSLSPDAPPGAVHEVAKLTLACKRLPEFLVEAKALVEAPYAVQPARLNVNHLLDTTYATAAVTAGAPLEILDAHCEWPGLEAAVEPGATPHSRNIRVSAAPTRPEGVKPGEKIVAALLFSVKIAGEVYHNRLPVTYTAH